MRLEDAAKYAQINVIPQRQKGVIQISAGGPGSGRHKGTPVEGYGNKGMKNTPWRKTFKSTDHLNDWAEKNSADVHGTRPMLDADIPQHWKDAGYHNADVKAGGPGSGRKPGFGSGFRASCKE